MLTDDNSVNIKSRGRGYHHGDLRSALIETGLVWLATRQGDDISLRELARLVGVSATAVYRHFPDKQALIAALCERGEAKLATAQRAAADAAGGGGSGFGASGEAYVRFALANPGLFRLMMSTRPATGWLTDVLDDQGRAMRGLRDDVAAVLPNSAESQPSSIEFEEPTMTNDASNLANKHAVWAAMRAIAECTPGAPPNGRS